MRILVVDDSALMRNQLSVVLKKHGHEVEYVRNGKECLDKLSTFRPEVITLDINMPEMDGITCLREIMRIQATPVVMVSSLTNHGAKATIEALELGAVDYIPKPSGSISLLNDDSIKLLLEKLEAATKAKLVGKYSFKQKFEQHQSKQSLNSITEGWDKPHRRQQTFELILIGVSTGGPAALQEITSALPATFPLPIVIAQHMPARFTKVFAKRLDDQIMLPVQELNELVDLKAGHIYLAQGDADLQIKKTGNTLTAKTIPCIEGEIWHPSVNHMVRSALEVVPANKLICVQLTGMGNDGANAMKEAHTKGAVTIAESQETATVYGMPKELVNSGGASYQLPNYKIAEMLCKLAQ